MTADLYVVVPVFNEEALLRDTAEELAVHLDSIIGSGRWGYILVDNGSTDRTPELAERIVQSRPPSRRLSLPRPDYGAALAAGLEAADSPYAFIVNADFWDPVFLSWCWQHRERYDLIIGSKRADFSLNRQPRYRVLLSWGLNTILQLLFGFVGTDTHGQKFLNLATMRPILEATVMRRGQFDTEFTLRAMRAGLWLAEVPVPIAEQRRQRNLMIRKIYQNLKDIVKLRRIVHKLPYKHAIRYHRWAREDMLELYREQGRDRG